MTNKEKMLNGSLYIAIDEDLGKISKRARKLMDKINKVSHTNFTKRNQLVIKLFGKTGVNPRVNSPIYVDYGVNVEVGANFYANYNLTLLDVNKIIIGNDVLIGPNVSIYTAGHPIDPLVRKEGYEFGLPVVIGDNVWIGGSVSINPGVTIGKNSIIGSGSVVTKDIPSDVIAIGNPARVYRKINNEDKIEWESKKEHYLKTIK